MGDFLGSVPLTEQGGLRGAAELTYCTIFWDLTDKLSCVFCASDMQYNLSVQQ